MTLEMHIMLKLYVFAVGFYNSKPLIDKIKVMNGLEIGPVVKETRHTSGNSQLMTTKHNESTRNKFSIFDW